jgi:hypothetical protein
MKKVIIISIMSLLFLATYAQRPSKSRSTEVNDIDRKKSEMTTVRSDNNTSRTVETKSDRSGNENNHSTYTPRNTDNRSDNSNYNRTSTTRNTEDRSDNSNYNRTSTKRNTEDRSDNNNRTITPRNSDDQPEKVYNDRTITPRNDDPTENVYPNRTIEDKINKDKTEIHKNIEPARSNDIKYNPGYTANDGRNRSINSRTYEAERRNYNTPDRNRVYREVFEIDRPRPVEYRRIHHPYRQPGHIDLMWTPRMYYDYRIIYPDFNYWYYPYGYRIRTVSAYDAIYYTGEIVNVYGRVVEAWFSWENDEYILYFGAKFPYQDFSVIIPGHKARQFSRRPEIFFEGRYIWVTGLVSMNNGQPEMVVMKKHQIHLY